MKLAILADLEKGKKWLEASKSKVSQAVGQKQAEAVLKPLVEVPRL